MNGDKGKVTGDEAREWTDRQTNQMFAAVVDEGIEVVQLIVIGIVPGEAGFPTTIKGIGYGPATAVLRTEISAAVRRAVATVNKQADAEAQTPAVEVIQ